MAFDVNNLVNDITLDNLKKFCRDKIEIQKTENGFQITNGEEPITCHKLIVACGGLAGSKLGGTMSGYKLLAKLGHRSTKLRPSLVQIKSSWPELPSLKGVRANCHVHPKVRPIRRGIRIQYR